MDRTRVAVVSTYLLAGGVCLTTVVLTGVFSRVPLPVTDSTATVALFVCLPLAVALAVIVRAGITRAAADVALAAFAVPCLLVSAGTLAGSVWASLALAPGSLASLGAGLLLSVVVLVDGALTRLAVPGRA